MRFTYQTHELGFQQTETVWPNPSAWGATKGNLIQNWGLGGGGTYTDVLDMNGDGRVDRVVYDRWTPEYETWGVYFNNGQDGFAPLPGGEDQPNWSNPSAWDDKKGNYIRNTDVDPTSGYNLGTFADVIDMDGDGLPDRVVYNKNCTSPYTDCPWTVYFNNGSGFVDSSPPPQEDVPNWENRSAWGPKNGNYIRSNKVVSGYNYGTMTEVVDMNGDGLPDRVVYDKDYVYHDPPDFQPANWKVYLNIYPNPNQDGLTGFSQSYDIWQNYSPWHNLKGNTIRTTRTDGSGTTADLIDMNGDGLPDRVVYDRDYNYNQNNFQAAKWKVYFNTGSGFEQDPIDWPNPSPWGNANGNNIRDTGTYGIQTDVIDVNGDGLPDRVVYDRTSPYTTWTVYFNYGAGFGPPVLQQGQPRPPGWDWPKPNPEGWGGEHDGNLISEHYYDGTYVYGTKAALFDIDGDGLPDRVLYKKNCNAPDEDCPWAVYLNKGPVTDLLSRIENGIGGATEITYKPSTAYEDGNGNKTNAIPFVVQTVYTYTVQDGRGAQYTHQYHYANADYDSAKVDFLGFGKVTAYQMRGTELEAKTEIEFHQRNEGQPDEYRRGKPIKQTVTSHEDHKRETQYTWNAGYETLGGGKFPALDSVTTTVTDVGPGGPWSYSQTTRDVYDTNSQNLEIQTLNLLEEHKNELCPTCESEDEVQTVMEYGGLNWGSWILDKPTMVAVTKYVDAGTPHRVQSRKWMDYNDDGGLTTEELCRSDAPDTGCLSRNPTQNVITTYQYDPTYKVLTQVVDPRGFTTTMTYDSTKTFVYETEKCIEGGRCFKTTTLYDAGIGNITKSVPPHLQGTSYWLQTQYDALGRKILERMKDNPDPNTPPIVDRGSTSYSYNFFGDPNAQNVQKTGRIVIEGQPERTLTLNGYTYFDGMGRTYMAKTDGPDGKNIRIETLFDDLGRVWKQSNPYYCDQTGCDPVYYTISTYDGLSRVTTVEKPDKPQGSQTGYLVTTEYQGLTKVVAKQVTTSDWQRTSYTYDLNQKLKKVGEGIGVSGQETYTEYKYDVLGNLVQVSAAKDALGNDIYSTPITTTMKYDSLMKKIEMTDPDMGSWAYEYDKFGNLTRQTDARGKVITFAYDGLNRVTEKVYVGETINPPEDPHKVTYTYDDPLVPYSKGKLTRVVDNLYHDGQAELKEDMVLEYDLFQRVKRSQKNIGMDSATFEKSYDSAGRVVTIKYLAGTLDERIYDYEYDVAGDLLYVQERGAAYPLVEYSEFTAVGQPQFATFPKSPTLSVKTSYTYYPDTGRLHTLVTEKIVNGQVDETYQDLIYEKADGSSAYDGAGNILELADGQNLITHHYTYDHLNRLTLANGVGTNAYTETYTYDRIGNITNKSGVGSYDYGNYSRPHQVQSAGPFTFTYDANGNMTSRTGGGDTVSIPADSWNYDNKPTQITKGTITVSFAYDGNGARVRKISPNRTVLYFGDVYEVRGGVGVIHVFAGNRRVASVRLDGRTQFYHPNHLGSASVITDQNGERKQQVEYYPFGTYRAVDLQYGTYDYDPLFPNVNYTFTDEEDDDELGFYNYGARLYDPVLGKFLSPDSIVQAPDDPQTLNRYSYARNNPIVYTDPSGNFFILDDIIVILSSFLVTQLGVTAGITAYTIAATITYGAFSAVAGAALGAATSAITGGDIGMGALTGAISGVIFHGAGNIVGGISGAFGATNGSLAQVAITTAVHTAAGAVSGATNSAITGSDIGTGVLAGAIGAGIGAAAGGALPDRFGYQLVGRIVSGAVAGGIAADLYGGNFWQGFAKGAATAAAAFLFNHCFHKNGEPDQTCDKYGWEEDADGTYDLRMAEEQNARNMEIFAKAGEAMQKAAVPVMRWLTGTSVNIVLFYTPGGLMVRFLFSLATKVPYLRSDSPQESK